MAYSVEIDPSGRAKCKSCDATIAQGSLRLINKYAGFNGHSVSDKYCMNCGKEHLKAVIVALNFWLDKLNKGVL